MYKIFTLPYPAVKKSYSPAALGNLFVNPCFGLAVEYHFGTLGKGLHLVFTRIVNHRSQEAYPFGYHVAKMPVICNAAGKDYRIDFPGNGSCKSAYGFCNVVGKRIHESDGCRVSCLVIILDLEEVVGSEMGHCSALSYYHPLDLVVCVFAAETHLGHCQRRHSRR